MGGPSALWWPRENNRRRREELAGSEWTLIERVDSRDTLRALGGSRIRHAYTGSRKPNLKVRCTFLKVLVSLAGSMVLPLLQTAQGAEVGETLHGQHPSSPMCLHPSPTGEQRRQPLTSRMFPKCASRMLLSTRERRPELPTQGLWDAEAQSVKFGSPGDVRRT